MDWLERLNRGPGRMPLGQGAVELLQWAYARHLPDNRPHRHTFFEVCLVGEYGQGEFIVQGRANRIGPGDLFIARPGVIHQIVNIGRPNMELSWVSFGWIPASIGPTAEADRLLRAFADSPVVVASAGQGQLIALWQALQAVATGPPGPAYEIQYQALVTAFILSIAQAGAEIGSLPHPEPIYSEAADRTVRLAVRFIHDNLNRPLSVGDLAAQVYLSPRHLSRLFTRFTGKSVASYITHARMDRARGLVLRSSRPIKEVAAMVCYPDVHHFTRVFTSHFGCPPGEMRRRPEQGRVLIIQHPGDLV